MSKPKILIWDIENTPIIGTTWGLWDTNVIEILQEPYILCFAYKWYGEKGKVKVVAQTDFPVTYSKNRTDDALVVAKAWELFDKADIIVAHNGIGFDTKKMNARFAYYGMPKPSPFREVDTLRIARKEWKLSSNKLDNIGEFLDLGKKAPSSYSLWKGCMDGDEKSWKLMKQYNKQDVVLLEKVYEYMLHGGWITNHPNLATISGDTHSCPKCGASREHLQKRGPRHTQTGTFQTYQCSNCTSYSRDRIAEKKEKTWLV